MPEPLDVLRVAADEAASGWGEEFFGAAFADAGNASVRFDGDDDVALIEERRGIGRLVGADAHDLHFRQRSEGGKRMDNGCGSGGGERLKKFSAMHGKNLRFQGSIVAVEDAVGSRARSKRRVWACQKGLIFSA